MFEVPSADRLALSEDVVSAPWQRLSAHATREAFHVEDQAGYRPHYQIRAADLLHASRALHPEDPLVIGTAVELEVAYKTRVRQHSATRRARETLLVIIPLGDSHHVLVGDGAAAAGADRLKEAGLRLHGNGWFCGNKRPTYYSGTRNNLTVYKRDILKSKSIEYHFYGSKASRKKRSSANRYMIRLAVPLRVTWRETRVSFNVN